MRAKSQVISGNAGLQSGEDENLTVRTDLENGAAAVADIKILRAVEGHTRGNAHALGIGRHGSVRSDTVNRPIVTRGNVHLSSPVKGDGSCIHQVREERLDVVVGVDLVDGDWNLLPAAARKTNVDVAFSVERRVGDRVQILGNGHCNFDLVRIAGVSVGRYHDGP